MELVDPSEIRLLPGQSMEAMFTTGPEERTEVGLFLRSASGSVPRNGDLAVQQRAGVIQFSEVLLVLTMVKVNGPTAELFDVWWNYHSPDGVEHFRRVSEQERLVLHFYNEEGSECSIDEENSFRRFFASLPGLFEKVEPWTDIEFDRAVRGFCAESYPKENLWDMIEFRAEATEEPKKRGTLDDYPGFIPVDLRPFYVYTPDQGHCIKIVPSILEDKLSAQFPDEYLVPAPVKTVLRCGIRWIKGRPVAPIPFIPGHGLAVPPEDTEL